MIIKTLLASVAIMLIATVNAEYNVAKYCELVKIGTLMPSMISCQDYYICRLNNQPIPVKCGANTVFDKDTQGCVPEAQANCILSLDNPCENKDRTFAPSSKACNEWHYCLNGNIVANGSCQPGQIFDASKNSCIYGACNSDDDDSNSDFTPVLNICDIMQNGQFFGDFENCQNWQKCNNGRLQKGICLGNLVYDTKNGMCLQNDGTMCERTNGMVSEDGGAPDETLCTSSNDGPLPDKLTCSVYYICEQDTTSTPTTYKWIKTSCPNGQYFDVFGDGCLDRAKRRVYTGCNRCEYTTGSTTYWVNAVSNDCTKFSTCRNGRKITNEDGSCNSGYYFNEADQYCNMGDFTNYAETNGACQNYSCNGYDCTTKPSAT
uniref:Peritrophin-48 n=1 Tax=Lucilia cuprina TaxID=7375 RepID=PE48A_LUCCU|nr:RecName: Full=Peritrophin-48; Flags: Precursor [Lucilia cuprina]AAB38414.1 peritrophin-48a precursor [Lucilia cuprina]